MRASKTSNAAVGIDRNDAANPTKWPGRRWRMSKPPAFGEGAKGHRGRLRSTFELPVHLEGITDTFPMKIPFRIAPVLAVCLCGQIFAQEVQTPPVTIVAEIPEPSKDAAPTGPTPVEKPDFKIESTQVKQIDVVEPPPMPGLPPVEGTMKLTVHGVADPGLPEIPATAPAPTQTNPRTTEITQEAAESHFVNISATVYDNSRTLLVCQPMGGDQPVTAWSNINFNHFSGLGNFEAKGSDGQARSYSLMMGIGNEASAQLADTPESPQIPALPNGTPVFQIITENPAPESVRLVEDLHALYRSEGAKMAADVAARELAEQKKREYLLAHPPKPKDVTVHFWQRNTAAENQTTEGSQP